MIRDHARLIHMEARAKISVYLNRYGYKNSQSDISPSSGIFTVGSHEQPCCDFLVQTAGVTALLPFEYPLNPRQLCHPAA